MMNKNISAQNPRDIQVFPQITIDSHPAVKHVLSFLEAQAQKNYQAFASCFDPDMNFPLFVNLPGGLLMRSPQELLERHKNFYSSSTFLVEYEELQDGVGNDEFFACSVLVHVTVPDGIKRTNYIDITVFKNQGSGPAWVPIRLINTLVDSHC